MLCVSEQSMPGGHIYTSPLFSPRSPKNTLLASTAVLWICKFSRKPKLQNILKYDKKPNTTLKFCVLGPH